MTEKNITLISNKTGSKPLRAYDVNERNKKTVTIKKLEKRLVRLTAEAITNFGMIQDGDKILVAMSGGKDSFAMLEMLQILQARAPIKFELFAVNIDQGIPGFSRETLENYLKQSNVPYHIENQDTFGIIRTVMPEGRNVCSLCSRLRRGVLYTVAERYGCTKIALGHQMDDIVSTLLLNQFYGGRLKGMPPILQSDNKTNIVIRPLAYIRESEIEKWSSIRNYPVSAKGLCGAAENLKRKEIKALMLDWDKNYPGRIYNIFMSLQRVAISHLMDKTIYDFENFKPNY